MRFMRKLLAITLLTVIGIGVFSWVVMLLWNNVMPAVFPAVSNINYPQALCMLLLSRILFGGLRGRGGFGGGRRWQSIKAMTPEERAQFLQRGQCGFSGREQRS